MGPAEILLLVRTKRSVLKADPTQIGRNHLASRDHLRGSPLYIGEIVSDYKEIHGNSKERVESESAGQNLFMGMCRYSSEILKAARYF
jgi:hypothetical protein